ncbi:MAG: OadG family protein [Clostridia bacterium]|nr:OadG family protein [Clostridia bacterium]
MVNNYALAVSSSTDSLGGAFSAERWIYAGQMTLIGMLMVFAVLAILWAVLAIFKVIFAGKEPKKVKTESPAPVVNTVPQTVVTPAVNTSDDELIAVITAAVAAYMAEETGNSVPDGSFRVVSFRRAGAARSWNKK